MWSTGLIDIRGNEIADKLAKETAYKAITHDKNTQMVSVKEIKQASKQRQLHRWGNSTVLKKDA